MTRKMTQWPTINPGDYARWRGDFEIPPVRQLLAKFAPSAAEHTCMILFVAHLGPRSLTREQVGIIWPELRTRRTRISLTDYVIMWLAALLKDKTGRLNEDVATLLTAADVPAGKSDAWEAEAVKKRRARVVRVAGRNSFLTSMLGPRLIVSRFAPELLRARRSG